MTETGDLLVNKPNQAKRVRGYILKRVDGTTRNETLEIYCTSSRALIRDKVLGNKKRRILMFDNGGLPLLFIPKEKFVAFVKLMPLAENQFIHEDLGSQKTTMTQVRANNYLVAKLQAVQANRLSKLGDEEFGERETVV